MSRPLLLTAGGSVFFDLVLSGLGGVIADDPATRLVLRSGAIFFGDHGLYERGMAALDARSGFVIDGAPGPGAAEAASVLRLNDQHAFVAGAPDVDLQVGDVIEFGLSHPCTCLDRHAVLYEIDADRRVIGALPLRFG